MPLSRKARRATALCGGLAALCLFAAVLLEALVRSRVEAEAARIARGRTYRVIDHRREVTTLASLSLADVVAQAVFYKLYLSNDVEISGSSRFREMHLGVRFSGEERYIWSFTRMTFVPAGNYLF